MRTSTIGALAVVGILAVGGLAFTAGNSLPSDTVVKGYASQTITGVTAQSVTYNTDTAGDTIESVGLVLAGDTTAKTISIAFNDEAPATCTGAGTFSVTDDNTTYTCTVNRQVADVNKFALVAT